MNGKNFNCGYCVNCRANKASQWKLRCLYELANHDSAIFITFTYSDEWLLSHNPTRSLIKKDIQDFNKRLRSDIDYQKLDINYRFYIAGEYSDPPKERPHYHGILFGLDRYNPVHRKLIIDNWCPPNAPRCEEWQFSDLSRGRKCGLQDVTPEDIGYTVAYVSKKLTGNYAKSEYEDKGREPPFHVVSQGLGLEFALENRERLVQNGYTTINGSRIGIPRYFRDKLGIKIEDWKNSDKTDKIKKDVDFLTKEFEKSFPSVRITTNPSSCTYYQRMFEFWYDSHRWELANIVFEEYQKRNLLLRGKNSV